jgi:hypothetical protein
MSTLAMEHNDVTIPTSNFSALCPKSYKVRALDHILQQNKFAGAAFCLKTDYAIADSETTQIFVIEGTPIVNKKNRHASLKYLLPMATR